MPSYFFFINIGTCYIKVRKEVTKFAFIFTGKYVLWVYYVKYAKNIAYF
jgi:hypothetical protein